MEIEMEKEREKVLESYEKEHPESRKLFQRGLKVIPGGVSHIGRYFEPFPLYMDRGQGPMLYDVDGKEYLDFWLGHGGLILGHGHESIVAAVQDQIIKGTQLGTPNRLGLGLCEKIVDMVPGVEQIRLCNSGTEATMHAVRLARAYTGKKVIGKMIGHFHGVHEHLYMAVYPPFTGPSSLGIPDFMTEGCLLLPFNDLAGTEKLVKERGDELAGIILEPVSGVGAIPAEKEYLKGLREMTDDLGIPLIFDEVVTGFRLAPGGAQEHYGITPDITTFGKIMGGGYPCGAFGGKKEIFEIAANMKSGKRFVNQGTYAANPITSTAGLETLKLLEDGRVLKKVNKNGDMIRKEIGSIFDSKGLDAQVTGVGSFFRFHFLPKDVYISDAQTASAGNKALLELLCIHLINNGVYVLPGSFMTLSIHHKGDVMNAIYEAVESFST